MRHIFTLKMHLVGLMVLFITSGLMPSPVEAKTFRNSYVSFELADPWDCELSGTEWVCRVRDPKSSKEAIVILTAKEVGPADSLSEYERYLKTPRSIANRQGKAQLSVIYKVQQRQIGNHPWVDGMHLGSEIPNYFSRYLATVKDRIAVLVTFSAHKNHYTKYVNDFFRAIESLRVVASSAGPTGGGAPGDTIGKLGPSGGPVDIALPGDDPGLEENAGTGGEDDKTTTWLGLALLVGAIGIYLMMKKKKKL